jgi:GDP-D-mannose 3', 5'-epimerase
MDSNDRIVVTGAGGFIGSQLVSGLLAQGHQNVCAVDCKPLDEWHQRFDRSQQVQLDLSERAACQYAVKGAMQVYNLAADMGGMGFIETHKAECMLSVLINTHLLMASQEAGVERFFFSSSACVYAADKQTVTNVEGLREEDAYPAMPEDGYGWEKLFSERMCRHFREDYGLDTRIARYHNVYGPNGSFDGGREKAPAAICRKVAECALAKKHDIEIWGDGNQTRSFMYISDCIFGTMQLMASDCVAPINLGSDQLVSINQLVDIVEEIAGLKLHRHYKLDAPTGVRGRNSDNTMVREVLDWAPSTALRVGLEATYRWIYDQLSQRTVVRRPAVRVHSG